MSQAQQGRAGDQCPTTSLGQASLGQGLMALNCAEMVLLGRGQAPGERTGLYHFCLHKATLSTDSQAMYIESFN